MKEEYSRAAAFVSYIHTYERPYLVSRLRVVAAVFICHLGNPQ